MQAFKDCVFSFLFAYPTKCLFWMSFLLGKHFCTWKYFQRVSEFYTLKTKTGYCHYYYYYFLCRQCYQGWRVFSTLLFISISVLVSVCVHSLHHIDFDLFIDACIHFFVKSKGICLHSFVLCSVLGLVYETRNSRRLQIVQTVPADRHIVSRWGCWILA